VVHPNLAAAKRVEGRLRGGIGHDARQRRGVEVLVVDIGAHDDAVFSGHDWRAAADWRAVVRRIEVDALVHALAVRSGGVGHELVALRQAATGDRPDEAAQVGRRRCRSRLRRGCPRRHGLDRQARLLCRRRGAATAAGREQENQRRQWNKRLSTTNHASSFAYSAWGLESYAGVLSVSYSSPRSAM
jgi:hypothetical protein